MASEGVGAVSEHFDEKVCVVTGAASGIILDGVAAGEGIIAFPEAPKQLWRQYCSTPETVESYLQQVARQRRSAFASGDVAALFRPPPDRGEA